MRKIRNLAILSSLFFGIAISGPLVAQTLFGAATGEPGGGGALPSNLYTIDPANGDATLIGPIGFDNVSGLAFLEDGRLVGSARGDGEALLIAISPADGSGSLIGSISSLGGPGCQRMPDLTYDASSGTLFGYSDFCDGGYEGLFTINSGSGEGTLVGPSGYSGGGNGLAAEPFSGTLYATPFDSGSLVVIDSGNGSGSDVQGSAGNVPFRVNALDFHPATGVLYGSFNDSGNGSFLVTIDLSDGTTTELGLSVDGLDALVFERTPPRPVPVMSGPAMLVLVLLMLAIPAFRASRSRAEA